jgi:plasmid stability protein
MKILSGDLIRDGRKFFEAIEFAAKASAEKLTQAILAKAFRGELVPTEAELARREGRSYEPAPELMARIRAEREIKGQSEELGSVREFRNALASLAKKGVDLSDGTETSGKGTVNLVAEGKKKNSALVFYRSVPS